MLVSCCVGFGWCDLSFWVVCYLFGWFEVFGFVCAFRFCWLWIWWNAALFGDYVGLVYLMLYFVWLLASIVVVLVAGLAGLLLCLCLLYVACVLSWCLKYLLIVLMFINSVGLTCMSIALVVDCLGFYCVIAYFIC